MLRRASIGPLMDSLERLNAVISNTSFLVLETFRSFLFSKRKMKILFSRKQDWEHAIKKVFQYTRHEVVFEELSPNNIKEFDLIVPLTIDDLKYLNRVRNLIIDNPIPIPSTECIRLCDDKYLFNQELISKGFGDFVPKMGGALKYPYVLKKRIDGWGKNSHIISNAEQELVFSDTLTDPEYFSQECITGRYEYATHIIFKAEKIVSSTNIEYCFKSETPIKGRDEPLYQKICRCRYLDLFTSIITSIGFNGLCCINYKIFNNRPFIFEINPRFGGSLCSYFFAHIRHVT